MCLNDLLLPQRLPHCNPQLRAGRAARSKARKLECGTGRPPGAQRRGAAGTDRRSAGIMGWGSGASVGLRAVTERPTHPNHSPTMPCSTLAALLIHPQHIAVRRMRVQHHEPVFLGHQQVGEPRCAVRLTGGLDHQTVAVAPLLRVRCGSLIYHARTCTDRLASSRTGIGDPTIIADRTRRSGSAHTVIVMIPTPRSGHR
jgi:hypothetical protein